MFSPPFTHSEVFAPMWTVPFVCCERNRIHALRSGFLGGSRNGDRVDQASVAALDYTAYSQAVVESATRFGPDRRIDRICQ